ncbi:SOS response-associated peptidase family protein [Desulfomicrobium norvegicum]|uniref:SOS response-associated peptidase family protein n=1 Tax=Desulfomicrobium norvegicum (strain DSM 1741 / NCIMB 8310) TaxID=52561 RepID=UPI00137B1D85
MAEKPTWRHSLRRLRCLMPAGGWYELNEYELVRSDSGRQLKQPYLISAPNADADAIAFAGLWAVWTGRHSRLALQGGIARHRAYP